MKMSSSEKTTLKLNRNVDVLSLPKQHTTVMKIITNQKVNQTGLPLNSIPGWEHLPLNFKLPMLPCPDNQVIFSKNKIGKTHKRAGVAKKFNLSIDSKIPEYNPLHDTHLRKFYAIDRNLKRLRENGEITMNNDVICTLKDFNEFRMNLYEFQLQLALEHFSRMDREQRDRRLVKNAMTISHKDYDNKPARICVPGNVLERKKSITERQHKRFLKIWYKNENIFKNIAHKNEMRRVYLKERKYMRNIQMKNHLRAGIELQRQRVIKWKKDIQNKSIQLNCHLAAFEELRLMQKKRKLTEFWEKRLEERIMREDKIHALLQEVEIQKQEFIEVHRKKYAEKWAQIQKEIDDRAAKTKKLGRKKKKKKRRRLGRKTKSFCEEHQKIFENLVDEELCEFLNAALKLDKNVKVSFHEDDPVYKAAQFINEHIIAKYNKDLSDDETTFNGLSSRIRDFLEEAENYVAYQATQVINAANTSLMEKDICKNDSIISSLCEQFPILGVHGKYVSFKRLSNTIGSSSYDIHPNIDIRSVADRKPTPRCSFDTIVIDSKESLQRKSKMLNSQLRDIIFVEHYLTKFKRLLIVGVSKRVFAAIQCHFRDEIMDISYELLDLDKTYLIETITKSILSYAVNPLDFDSALRLSINTLANDIIWDLQKDLLCPKQEPCEMFKAFCCVRPAVPCNICEDCKFAVQRKPCPRLQTLV